MRPKFWWLKVEKVTKMLWKIMIWCSLSFRLERCLLWKWHHSFRSFLIFPMCLLEEWVIGHINQVECKLKKCEKFVCPIRIRPKKKSLHLIPLYHPDARGQAARPTRPSPSQFTRNFFLLLEDQFDLTMHLILRLSDRYSARLDFWVNYRRYRSHQQVFMIDLHFMAVIIFFPLILSLFNGAYSFDW
jgi:hypothetical protein